MPVSDITDVTWNENGWDGSYFVINGNQISPKVVAMDITANGTGVGSVPFVAILTDPLGRQYSITGTNSSFRWDISLGYVGSYHIELTFTDSSGTQTFTHDLQTITTYNAGNGVVRDIPIGTSGQAASPWEWLPGALREKVPLESYIASGNLANAGLAFDDSASTYWEHVPGGTVSDSNPIYIGGEFEDAVAITGYSFRGGGTLNGPSTPRTWKFQGDMDDDNWVDLDNHAGENYGANADWYFFFDNDIAYKRYRLYVTDVNTSYEYLRLYTLAFFNQEQNTAQDVNYYNRGDGVFVQMGSSMTPVNNSFHCDPGSRQCRPIYTGTPLQCQQLGGANIYNNMTRLIQPLRDIPAALLAHKRQRSQSTCWCWVIKPKRGDWEGYTSLDRNIDLPEYTDKYGNTVPAMTYVCAGGLAPTTMPVRLSLSKNSTDVTVLAFDRTLLQTQYYLNAEYECFEINYLGNLAERWVGSSGVLGNTSIGDTTATMELIPWSDLANRPIGREVSVLCDVGQVAGEEFGTGRCRNMSKLDGPIKDDWTVEFWINNDVSGNNSKLIFQLYNANNTDAISPGLLYSPPYQTISGKPVPANWHLHLRNGKVLFTVGENAGVEREIKTAAPQVYDAVTHSWFYGIVITLKNPAPFDIARNDKAQITVGCNKTTTDCKFFDNIDNFRGMPYVPGREGVLRRWKAN